MYKRSGLKELRVRNLQAFVVAEKPVKTSVGRQYTVKNIRCIYREFPYNGDSIVLLFYGNAL